jgi:ribonuclease HI
MMPEKLDIYSDGGARGNPGEAGIGIVISKPVGRVLHEFKCYIGVKTNNQAEYAAILKALELAKDYGANSLNSYMDSELVVKQLKGEYRVRNPRLKELFLKVKRIERDFEEVNYIHVSRQNEKIQIADRLVNEAIDEKVKKR